MKIDWKVLALVMAAQTTSFGALGQQAPTAPTKIDLADQPDVYGQVAARAKASSTIDPNRKIVVSGDYHVGVQQLTARELVFKPNGRLIFDNQEPNVAGQFFIVADRIEIEDPLNAGVITWNKPTRSVPADRGQAGPGPNGASEGANGTTGGNGAQGNPGLDGEDAPALTIFVRTIATGGLVVDFRGADGGQGGIGQQGGNGGAGAQGSGASQARSGLPFGGTLWQPWCESGPGRGGDGGPGGAGGSGGVGGRGGRGGNVTLASLASSVPVLFQTIRVNIGGGVGGGGGAGGNGGAGGAGGPEGPLANFCNSSGRNGSLGGTGPGGATGPNGDPGGAGQPFVLQVTEQQFHDLFGF